MAKINAFQSQKGWIEVICGPMFSGKSEELLRRINLLKFSEVKYLLFTPSRDTRTGAQKAKSRDGREVVSITVENSRQIIDVINNSTEDIQLIAIDEAQFFDKDLADICSHLANHGYIVMVAGLDLDSFGRPFEVMMKLLVSAEKITKLKAVCTNCGATASFTDHLKPRDKSLQVMVGDKNEYTARCRKCHSCLKELTEYLPPVKESK